MVENQRNNSEFWQALEQLVESRILVVDRPKGTVHPLYPDTRYPLDYGYLEGTFSSDSSGIDIWVGSEKERKVSAIVISLDLVKLDSEMKIIFGCSQDEIQLILDFMNCGSMHAILVQKTWSEVKNAEFDS